jgi:hypothetical protein
MQGVTSENTGEKRERARKEENTGMTGIAETTEITEPMVIAGTKEIVAIIVTRTSSAEKQGSGERKKGEITRTMQIAGTKEIAAISVTRTGSAKKQGSRERKGRKTTRTMVIAETKEIVAIRQGMGDIETIRLSASFL